MTQNSEQSPIRNWKSALNRFMIMFEDRLADFI
jgi:transposase-like protein